MAPRSSWKGFLRLSLVSVPVQAFNAAETGGGEFHFHQLHAECNSRIRYKKVCPIHGEVANSEIVSGYEYAKGKYVILESDELDKLRSESDKAINIDTFIKPDQIDPMYFDGRTYYLVPDGPMGQKPYAVLHRGMAEQKVCAVAQGVFSGKEQLMLVRPIDNLLAVEMLHYQAQVRGPSVFEEYVSEPAVSKEELRLAATLIQASIADNFDFGKFKDLYTERVREFIEAKVEGKEIIAEPDEDVPVINLMDALRKSVAQSKQNGKPARPAAKKMAASRKKARTLKKKSS